MIKKYENCANYQNLNAKETLISHDILLFPWKTIADDSFLFSGDIYLLVVDHYSKC